MVDIDSVKIYLDHAGATQPSIEQMEAIGRDLVNLKLSNPHSRHQTSIHTRDIIDRARNRILQHFNTSSDEYSVVFTLNATHALKTVAECFDFGDCTTDCEISNDLRDCPDGIFAYMHDAHTSVVGMRELVRSRCSRVCVLDIEQLLDPPDIPDKQDDSAGNDLFVITAMSNFCGRKYPLEVVESLHRRRPGRSFVCLDAASWAATSSLNLSLYNPDFVTISMYKMLGYPTGVGALLVKNESCHMLKKKYFGGGTVDLADHDSFTVHHKKNFIENFEDGTVDFYGIAALERGFDDIEAIGTIHVIEDQTYKLSLRAFQSLKMRKHQNGKNIAEVYCADPEYGSKKTQGPIVAFNLLRDDGSYVGYTEVEKMCDLFGIELRSGCFCNQGACQKYLRIPCNQLTANYEKGKICGDSTDLIDGRPVGALRISFGRQSDGFDVRVFLSMLEACFVSSASLMLPQTSGLNHQPKLKDIFVYPVKSCHAIHPERWQVGKAGFLHDRQWMVASREGSVLTQKRCPKLCSILPQVTGDKLWLRTRTGKGTVSVPLGGATGATPEQRRVCIQSVETIDCGDDVAKWLGDRLDQYGCRLHRVFDSSHSAHSKDCDYAGANLSNQAPFLLINRRSAMYLAQMVGLKAEEVTRRFRANLIVDGFDAFEEDTFKTFSIGDVHFKVTGHCTRCQMICIDQNNGHKDAALLLALRDYRLGSKITFGVYLQLDERSNGAMLHTGMPIAFTD